MLEDITVGEAARWYSSYSCSPVLMVSKHTISIEAQNMSYFVLDKMVKS